MICVIIDGLDFNHQKRISSKIVKFNNQFIIFCKGSITEMKKRVVSEDKQLIDDRDLDMTFVNPLRVMACGFRYNI